MMPNPSAPASPNLPTVRLLLVDDVAPVRQELRQLLEVAGGIQIVGEAGNGLEAVRLSAETAPDVVVMDLEMPVLGGLEATRRIKACSPAPRIVILSVYAGPALVQSLREAGADDFIIKGSDYRVLLNAIHGMDQSKSSLSEGDKS